MPWDAFCPKCCSCLAGGDLGDRMSSEEIEEDIKKECGNKIFLCTNCKGTKFDWKNGEVVVSNYTETYIDYDMYGNEIGVITKEEAEASGKEIVLGG